MGGLAEYTERLEKIAERHGGEIWRDSQSDGPGWVPDSEASELRMFFQAFAHEGQQAHQRKMAAAYAIQQEIGDALRLQHARCGGYRLWIVGESGTWKRCGLRISLAKSAS